MFCLLPLVSISPPTVKYHWPKLINQISSDWLWLWCTLQHFHSYGTCWSKLVAKLLKHSKAREEYFASFDMTVTPLRYIYGNHKRHSPLLTAVKCNICSSQSTDRTSEMSLSEPFVRQREYSHCFVILLSWICLCRISFIVPVLQLQLSFKTNKLHGSNKVGMFTLLNE